MKIIDTHAHLNFTDFAKDYKSVLLNCKNNGLAVINVGTNYLTSRKAVEIAEAEEDVYAAIGLHALNISYSDDGRKVCDHLLAGVMEKPEDFLECDFDYELYKKLGGSKKVVAIGEVGLDYYYKPKTKVKLEVFKNKQLEILKKQTDLARELDLPVIFHVRMAHEDLIGFLEGERTDGKNIRGAIHCFTGTPEQAKTYLDLGLYIGLNGIIFKMDLEAVITLLPEDRILFETDCPYLTPPQAAGRNEPANIKHVIERVAKLRNADVKDITEAAYNNAAKLFGLV